MKKLIQKKPVRAAKAARKSTAKDKALDAVIDACAPALGLRIEKAWRPSIRANLDVTFKHAARVMEFPLPDDAEPAPIYRV
jgi:hypothetical protein